MKKALFYLLAICFISCSEQGTVLPKPRMFPKVNYPARSYEEFNEDYCNFKFLYPGYGIVIRDTVFFEEDPASSCWFDIVMTDLNGRLHFSYYPIGEDKNLDELIADAFTFVEKHDIKANYRSESNLVNPNGSGGILFEIDGPVASPIQFFLTDSIDHFLRASLYFNNKTAPDSMAPVHKFVMLDVLKIIESLDFSKS